MKKRFDSRICILIRRNRIRRELYKKYGRESVHRARVDFCPCSKRVYKSHDVFLSNDTCNRERDNNTNSDDITEFVIDRRRHLLRYTGCAEYVSIPESESVCAICENAFGGCRHIKCVIIPKTVSTVHSRAFRECDALVDVVIEGPKTKLCKDAFLDCRNLSQVYCAESHSDFESAFRNCGSDWKCLPHDKVLTREQESSDDYTVNYKGFLLRYHGRNTEAKIPYSVCSILPNAFSKCDTIKRIIIPESVSAVCRDAFHHCGVLEEITILNPNIKIDANAIHDCPALTRIVSPFNYLKDRQRHAFENISKEGAITFLPLP